MDKVPSCRITPHSSPPSIPPEHQYSYGLWSLPGRRPNYSPIHQTRPRDCHPCHTCKELPIMDQFYSPRKAKHHTPAQHPHVQSTHTQQTTTSNSQGHQHVQFNHRPQLASSMRRPEKPTGFVEGPVTPSSPKPKLCMYKCIIYLQISLFCVQILCFSSFEPRNSAYNPPSQSLRGPCRDSPILKANYSLSQLRVQALSHLQGKAPPRTYNLLASIPQISPHQPHQLEPPGFVRLPHPVALPFSPLSSRT